MTPETAAYIYSGLMAIVVLFQFTLAMGAPWGSASMGGKYPGVYPKKMRPVAVINGALGAFLAMIVLSHAGIAFSILETVARYLIWFVVVFSAVGTVLNTITPSKIERIWAPVVAIQFVCALIVALS